ncbi:MAG: nitroreductase [Desulfuromonas sp.]|nr:MAG: nitroreductase [Desulfuromonas sp.]
MSRGLVNPRTPECEVNPLFSDRWSPRAFLSSPLTEAQREALFEAARWTPSCYNDQPWFFLYAESEADRALFVKPLVEKNRQWAKAAPLLIYVLARRHFSGSERENRHAAFDAGAAWMALALQARQLGLYAHAMAGFDRDLAAELLKIPLDRYDILAAVAVGERGEADQLPADLAALEKPNERQALPSVVQAGRFKG